LSREAFGAASSVGESLGVRSEIGPRRARRFISCGSCNIRQAIDSIAVLPFSNASRDPEGDYLSEGITDSIINGLSQIAQLRVIPRSTVFRYKTQDLDPQAVGRELDCAWCSREE